jgi:hypothetical protein
MAGLLVVPPRFHRRLNLFRFCRRRQRSPPALTRGFAMFVLTTGWCHVCIRASASICLHAIAYRLLNASGCYTVAMPFDFRSMK